MTEAKATDLNSDRLSAAEIARARSYAIERPSGAIDPRLSALVHELIGRVADKWTMLVLEVLEEYGVVRFTRLGELVGGVSQKMLTKTLRQLERDGLVTRRIFMEVPPRVEYALTPTGRELMLKFLPLWLWIVEQLPVFVAARRTYEARLAAE